LSSGIELDLLLIEFRAGWAPFLDRINGRLGVCRLRLVTQMRTLA